MDRHVDAKTRAATLLAPAKVVYNFLEDCIREPSLDFDRLQTSRDALQTRKYFNFGIAAAAN